jgi:hypothetical protein
MGTSLLRQLDMYRVSGGVQHRDEIGIQEQMIWIVRAGEGGYRVDQFVDQNILHRGLTK